MTGITFNEILPLGFIDPRKIQDIPVVKGNIEIMNWLGLFFNPIRREYYYRDSLDNKIIIWQDSPYQSILEPAHFTPPYDSSYDFLMPVVEKICCYEYERESVLNEETGKVEVVANTAYFRTFGMKNDIYENKFMFRINRSPLFQSTSFVEGIWLAVVDFCTRANKEK